MKHKSRHILPRQLILKKNMHMEHFKSEHLKKEIITYLFKFTKQGFSIPKYLSLSLISRELILNSNLFVI